ncbi:MAG TPA: VWA domain-containing protein [Acidimicrobiales bacterium]|nr:VWA domain-containing protein [Acidimicrobiales bacterium]
MSGVAPLEAGALSPTGRIAVGLTEVLRGAGVVVPTGALVEFASALELLGLADLTAVYHAGRATLLTSPEQLALYDRCFSAFFTTTTPPSPVHPQQPLPEQRLAEAAAGEPAENEAAGEERRGSARYSPREVLSRRDFATLSEEERAEASRLLAELRLRPNDRKSRRRRTARHPTRHPDLRAVVRRSTRRGGELRIDRYLEAVPRPRRLVLLLDVSGSMEGYTRELLRFAQVAVRSRPAVEVFTLGTRLTRLTRALAAADADLALGAAVAAIADLAGGTRLGEVLGTFNRDFGVRGLARGADVVICSDGIDRGDPARLGEELARLRRVAHRVIWVNPLKASPGYAPLARGMAAALPHIDEFLEGHSVNAFAALAAALAARRAAPPPVPAGS